MGFWSSIDNINKEDLVATNFNKAKEKWEETSQLLTYNPITDKFYEEFVQTNK